MREKLRKTGERVGGKRGRKREGWKGGKQESEPKCERIRSGGGVW